jgi:hypothetical protein
MRGGNTSHGLHRPRLLVKHIVGLGVEHMFKICDFKRPSPFGFFPQAINTNLELVFGDGLSARLLKQPRATQEEMLFNESELQE